MKTNALKITAMILMLAGSLSSCRTKDEIDMSEIDFSNIENLYAQPLPIIQKCVQGKWKWYATWGGVVGIAYHDSTFVDIYDDHYTVTHDGDDGSQRTVYFTWKKCFIDDDGYETWAMWNKERDRGIWFFESIRNDSLSVGSVPPPGATFWHFGDGFIRAK